MLLPPPLHAAPEPPGPILARDAAHGFTNDGRCRSTPIWTLRDELDARNPAVLGPHEHRVATRTRLQNVRDRAGEHSLIRISDACVDRGRAHRLHHDDRDLIEPTRRTRKRQRVGRIRGRKCEICGGARGRIEHHFGGREKAAGLTHGLATGRRGKRRRVCEFVRRTRLELGGDADRSL